MSIQKFWKAESAELIGDVEIGRGSGIYYQSVIRTEKEPVRIGEGTNLQDGVIVHTDEGFPVEIGNGVTVGHRAVIHGARLEDNCLVGMGAIVMNGAVVESESMVAAGALVPEGRVIHRGMLAAGVPAREIRKLTPKEIQGIYSNAALYREEICHMLESGADQAER